MFKGVTLIEVLVTAAIVAILAAIAVPGYKFYLVTTQEKTVLNLAATIAQEAAVYYVQKDIYPRGIDLSAWQSVDSNSDYTVTLEGQSTIVVTHSSGAVGKVNYKP